MSNGEALAGRLIPFDISLPSKRRCPKAPKGDKRPADVTGTAVKVMWIATGEEEEYEANRQSASAELGRKGGKAQAESLSKKRRTEIACRAAEKRGATAALNRICIF